MAAGDSMSQTGWSFYAYFTFTLASARVEGVCVNDRTNRLSRPSSPAIASMTKAFSFLELESFLRRGTSTGEAEQREMTDMDEKIENRNILEATPLVSPREVQQSLPIAPAAAEVVLQTRRAIRDIIHGRDMRRLLVVIGPCSIHDPAAALDYAQRLKRVADTVQDQLVIVMRTYFEKPRTTVGWKGLINDPRLDGSCQIAEGLNLGAHAAAEDQQSRPALRQRDARSGHAAVHRRSGELGGDRRAHHRKPDAPRNGQRVVDARRLQERHRRRHAGGAQRHDLRAPRTQFSGHQRRRRDGHHQDAGQSRPAHRPARRRRRNELQPRAPSRKRQRSSRKRASRGR